MSPPDQEPHPGTTFELRGRSSATLLVQPRPLGNPAYVVYGAPGARAEVYVHARVLEELRTAALDAVPNETIGALLGRPCRDSDGTYVVVDAAITAALDEHDGTRGNVRISAAGRGSLHARAAQRHPALEPVGWWHSHPRGAARYSVVDLEEQATYPREHHVGIVVAAELYDTASWRAGGRDSDPLGVYVGPAAQRLQRQDDRQRATVPRVAPPAVAPPAVAAPAAAPAAAAPAAVVPPAAAPAAAVPPAVVPRPEPTMEPRRAAGPSVPANTGITAVLPGPWFVATLVVLLAAGGGLTALVVAGRDSEPPAPVAAAGSDREIRTCSAGERIGLGASGRWRSDKPSVADVTRRGTRRVIACKRKGIALLTRAGAPGRRIEVRVASARSRPSKRKSPSRSTTKRQRATPPQPPVTTTPPPAPTPQPRPTAPPPIATPKPRPPAPPPSTTQKPRTTTTPQPQTTTTPQPSTSTQPPTTTPQPSTTTQPPPTTTPAGGPGAPAGAKEQTP